MINWIDENHGTVFNVPMRVVRSDFNRAKTTDDEIVVLKWREFFDDYKRYLPKPKRVLELGIFEGGSIFVLAAMWPETQFIGVDLRPENPAVLRHVERTGLSDRVQIHYGVSQSDRAKLAPMLREFRPDMIIDDASHFYELSKQTFDICFPYLEPGGDYVLEDWGWAHFKAWDHFKVFEGKVALSNLVWEIAMASATSGDIVESVFVNKRFTIARKKPGCQPLPETFRLEDIYTARGKTISDTDPATFRFNAEA